MKFNIKAYHNITYDMQNIKIIPWSISKWWAAVASCKNVPWWVEWWRGSGVMCAGYSDRGGRAVSSNNTVQSLLVTHSLESRKSCFSLAYPVRDLFIVGLWFRIVVWVVSNRFANAIRDGIPIITHVATIICWSLRGTLILATRNQLVSFYNFTAYKNTRLFTY